MIKDDLNTPDESASTSGTETNPNGEVQKSVSPARSADTIENGSHAGKLGSSDLSTVGWNGAMPIGLDGLEPTVQDSGERMLAEMSGLDGAACLGAKTDGAADFSGTGVMSDVAKASGRDPEAHKDTDPGMEPGDFAPDLWSEDAMRDPESKHDSGDLMRPDFAASLRDPESEKV